MNTPSKRAAPRLTVTLSALSVILLATLLGSYFALPSSFWGGTALAQQAPEGATALRTARSVAESAAAQIAEWDTEAAEVEDALAREGEKTPEALATLRGQLQAQRAAAQTMRADLRAALRPLQTQRDALGDAPEEGVEEDADLAERRADLSGQITGLEGRIKEVDLAEARAETLIAAVAERERRQFTRRLLAKGPNLANLAAWEAAARSAPGLIGRLTADIAPALAAFDPFGEHILLLLTGIAALFLLVVIAPRARKAACRLAERRVAAGSPATRIGLATVEFLLRAVPAPLAIFLVAMTAQQVGSLTEPWIRLSQLTVDAVAIIAVVSALAHMIFTASPPAARLAHLEAPRDAQMARAIVYFAAVLALFRLALELLEILNAPVEALTLVNAIAALAAAPWLLSIAAGIRVPEKVEKEVQPTLIGLPDLEPPPAQEVDWRGGGALLIRAALRAASVGLIVAAALGYYALVRFILEGSAMTAGLGAVCAVLFVAIEHVIAPRPEPAPQGEASALATVEEMSDDPNAEVDYDDVEAAQQEAADAAKAAEGPVRASGLARLTIASMLAIASAPVLGLIWGASQADIQAIGELLFGGVQVGEFSFSLTAALIAISVVIIGMWLTRLAQRVLNRSVLPSFSLEQGVRTAISAGVGYIGFFVTALFAISATGVDLSNLAIIAGALSVGVGFGLQNVVNNFVSGLILLIERPIQVGDWIEVGAFSGKVRRINVRSTEIQTFDRSTVVVPNSELISASVVNWTHRSLVGRAIVSIGVSYDSDPERVREILSEVALQQPLVLNFPPPFIYFKDFGASSLDFEIRCFLRDINSKLSVESAIRYALFQRLREEGVEIPFPQRDVHVRSAAGLSGEPALVENGAAPTNGALDRA
ncbi:MAG: DUF3772 domain-containing protein [Pseudomonadota bacterium]